MSIRLDQEAWRKNPWFEANGPQTSDYTGFYVAISICTLVVFAIVGVNFVLCCCSPYKKYWRDPNTGNRLLFPVFILSPAKQAPLTLQPEIQGLTGFAAPKYSEQEQDSYELEGVRVA